ncbi:C39 family peptidase [Mycoplasma hominis]|uniref:C39 family peptidase n=1 Tax=Metamycoplasma hominis TaxID=2098 RepID=UPI001F1B8065|nr:C39 family peptidase [Metamycoplasma hominis]MCF1354696.1 C39 family peptidase [Metamycoplasma hominis]
MLKIKIPALTLVASAPCCLLSINANDNNNYKELTIKITNTIQRFFGKNQQFKYIKKLNGEYLYIQCSNFYAIIDKNNFSIVEIKKGYHNYDDNINYSFNYLNNNNNNNELRMAYEENSFSPIVEDKLDVLPNISNKIKNSWWWATRNTKEKIGYVDQTFLSDKYDNSGLCEYIAISNILLYNELFNQSGIFTNEEFNDFFKYDNYDNSIENASPIFRYYQYDHADYSLVAKLWRLNKRWLNFYSYNSYTYSIDKFLNGKDAKNKYEYDYKMGAYYYKATQNIKNNNPVIVSTAKTMHAFIIYGYDEETQMVLLNWLWGNNDSIVLVNYWKLAASGSPSKIIFTMKPKANQELATKKLFNYKNTMYTGDEMEKFVNEKK